MIPGENFMPAHLIVKIKIALLVCEIIPMGIEIATTI